MAIDKNKWQKAFERQLDIAEKKQVANVKRYYKSQYNKGINSFISEGQTNFQLLFDEKDLLKIYRNLYVDIGLRFANWYAKNFDKFIKKSFDTKPYNSIWENSFASYGSAIGAQRVTLVSGTAKKTLIGFTQKLMRDPVFMTLGAEERGRILRNQFNKYSQYQSERLVRTEATAAANFAQTEAAQTIFPKEQLQKEWIASFDDRTRDSHAEAGSGNPINAKDTFLVGGQFMMFPGDPAGGAAEVINCRCSVAYFPKEGAETVSDIESISFGIGGASNVGFGTGNISNFIAPSVTTTETLNFVPAKSTKEAEERLLKFAPKINFKGIKLNEINEILEPLEEILGKYKIKLKRDIGFQIKPRKSLGVAGRSFENELLYIRLQKTFTKNSLKVQKQSKINYQKNKNTRVNRLRKILNDGNRPQVLLDRSKQELEALLKTERWAIYQEGTRPLYTTTIHEAFHVVDYKFGLRDIFTEELKKQGITRNDWYKVSEYGGSKIAELFTETATAIHTGVKIPIEFINAFNETIKTIKI